MRKEPQIYRLPTVEGPRYVHALEVRPGILLHPDLSYNGDEPDWDDEGNTWTLTHKDSGMYIADGIVTRGYARKAANVLARIENHVCEWHWMYLNDEWLRVARLIRKKLPMAETWPAEIH
jgi:hypothetical protein